MSDGQFENYVLIMGYEPGYGLTDERLRQLLTLGVMLDLGHGWHQTSELAERLGGPWDSAVLAADLQLFEARGWIEADDGAAESPGPLLYKITAAGEQAARQLREVQDNRGQRRKVARDALLRWIHEQTVATSMPPSMEGFISSPMSRYYVSYFSVDEVAQASEWLKQQGFIRGTQRADGIVDVPIITAEGERVVESGRSVNDPERSAPASVINYITQTGAYSTAQAAGHGATQHVTNQITEDHRKQTLQLAEVIEQTQERASLSPDARQVVAELRAAVEEGQNDRGKLRVALERAKTTIMSGMGEMVGKAMLAGFTGLLAHYGIPLS